MQRMNLVLSVVALGLLGGVTTAGDPPSYRLVDLGALGYTPSGDNQFDQNTFGLNEHEEAVGGFVNASSTLVGFIWLPTDAYGLAAVIRHDLSDLAGTTTRSLANDISDDGLVVGQQGDPLVDGEAIVWNVAGMQSPLESVLLGTLEGPTSVAYAVTNGDLDEANVAGSADLDVECGAAGGGYESRSVSMRMRRAWS